MQSQADGHLQELALQGNRALDAPIDATFVLFFSAASATSLDSSMVRLHRRTIDAP